MKSEKIQLFENKKIRTAWDEENSEWYFAIMDVVGVLTDSPVPRKYWSVLKTRLKQEGVELTTICSQLKMLAEASATEISKIREPEGFDESQHIAVEGAKVAKEARTNIESRTGQSAISRQNAKNLPGRMDNELQLPENE